MGALDGSHFQEISYVDPLLHLYNEFEELVYTSQELKDKLSNAGVGPEQFMKMLFSAASLALGTQLTETREKVSGLRSTVQKTWFSLPAILADGIMRHGSFLGPDGKEWLVAGFEESALAMNRVSKYTYERGDFRTHSQQYWLPVRTDDCHTYHTVASRLYNWIVDKGFFPSWDQIRTSLFGGSVPPSVAVVMSSLDIMEKEMINRLFSVWSTAEQFTEMFLDEIGQTLLYELELKWDSPCADYLMLNKVNSSTGHQSYYDWNAHTVMFQRVLGSSFKQVRTYAREGFGCKSQASILSFLEDQSTIDSYYALNTADKNELSLFKQEVLLSGIPMRMRATGLFAASSVITVMLMEDFGLC